MKRIFSIAGRCLGFAARVLGTAGRATVALVGICGVVAFAANYTMTQGAGTTFGSIVVAAVNYPQMLLCDLTTPSQCASVSAGGAVSVSDPSGVGTPGSAVPGTGIYGGGNVGGNFRGWEGSGPASHYYQATLNAGSTWNTVAASQTAQVLSATSGGGTGATGDYLSHCILQPTTTAAGTMTILDNATVIFTFTTGTLSNLAPIAIPVGSISTSGAWKVTTGANESVSCFGKFS